MENHSYDEVIGTSAAPYLTRLARECGTATRWSAVGAPSLPNDLAMTSGTQHDVSDDLDPAAHPLRTDNLFRQVRDAGGTVRSYAESMPGPCALTTSGRYAARHNPGTYYVGGDDRAACAKENLPLSALDADLASGRWPTFMTITPDLCHDMHDCGVSEGDAFLATLLPRLLGSATYAAGRTAVVVVWDESTPIPNVVIAPTVPGGAVLARAVDHYDFLRTTEELLGLDTFLGEADHATSMRSAFAL